MCMNYGDVVSFTFHLHLVKSLENIFGIRINATPDDSGFMRRSIQVECLTVDGRAGR